MSAVGENSSDPARSEGQKRKECPSDLLGPRYLTHHPNWKAHCSALSNCMLCSIHVFIL